MPRKKQIRHHLNATAGALGDAGIDDAELEAEFMLRHVLRCDRVRLLMQMQEELTPEQQELLRDMLSRRLHREPLAYILGEWDFRGRTFLVNPSVLIPRPETEQLVETVLELHGPSGVAGKFRRLLDVGCGSGAISVSLALEGDIDMTVAMDISLAAIEIAAENAQQQGAIAYFALADLRHMPFGQCFDLVVANLPYIASGDIEHLMPEVARFEPRAALDGGVAGTSLLQALAEGLDAILQPGGWVVLEIGAEQEHIVIELFQGLQYDQVAVLKDYAGRPRILRARKG